MKMLWEVKKDDKDGYYVVINGETIMECLSKKEVERLTASDIREALRLWAE